jgi:hypothetical protein
MINFNTALEKDNDYEVLGNYESEVPRFRNLFVDKMNVFLFESQKTSQTIAVHAFSITEAQRVLDEEGRFSDYEWTGKFYGPEDNSWYFDCVSYL